MAETPKEYAHLPRLFELRVDGDKPVVVVDIHAFIEAVSEPVGDDGEIRFEGDPAPWGVYLADLVQHVADAHHRLLCELSEKLDGHPAPSLDGLRGRILQVLLSEISSPTEDHTSVLVSAKESPEA